MNNNTNNTQFQPFSDHPQQYNNNQPNQSYTQVQMPQVYNPQPQLYNNNEYGSHPAQPNAMIITSVPPVYSIPVSGVGPVIVLRPGEPNHLPRGRWSDDVFDCCSDFVSCLLSWFWFTRAYRWALTISRLNLKSFFSAFLIMFILETLIVTSQIIIEETRIWPIYSMFGVALILLIYLGTLFRGKIRLRYDIPGSCCEDFLCWTFCSCCAMAQEARHVDRDYGILI